MTKSRKSAHVEVGRGMVMIPGIPSHNSISRPLDGHQSVVRCCGIISAASWRMGANSIIGRSPSRHHPAPKRTLAQETG